MANVYKDISEFIKKAAATGNEEFQVSATEKITAQQIADLASVEGVKYVVVTNFRDNSWTLNGQSITFSSDIKVGELVTFESAKTATNGPDVPLKGYAIKISSLMALYIGTDLNTKVNGTPTLYVFKSASLYDTSWQKLPADEAGIPVGTTLWEGSVQLGDNAPDTFDFSKSLQSGDLITVIYDLTDPSDPNTYFVSGINVNRTFNFKVGESLSNIKFSGFYNSGGSNSEVISDVGVMTVSCTESQLTMTVSGGESYPIGNRITVKRIYKSAHNKV